AEFFQPAQNYRTDFGSFRSPLIFADGKPVTNASDWPRRREEILSTWHSIMGPWPPLIEHPRLETTGTTHRENISQHRLRVEIALGGEMVDGLLLLPEDAGKTPARK